MEEIGLRTQAKYQYHELKKDYQRKENQGKKNISNEVEKFHQ